MSMTEYSLAAYNDRIGLYEKKVYTDGVYTHSVYGHSPEDVLQKAKEDIAHAMGFDSVEQMHKELSGQ